MYFGKKNITKNLAVSEEVANIALPKSRCHTENTYFCRNTANFLSGVISFDDGTLASFREGFASFVTYITKLSDQCQSPLKVELRRKASRLPYSLRNRLHLLISYQSHSLSKKLANLFAEFKTLCIFVSANILKSVSDTVLYNGKHGQKYRPEEQYGRYVSYQRYEIIRTAYQKATYRVIGG